MTQFKTIVIDPPWTGPGGCQRFPHHGTNEPLKNVVLPYSSMTGVQISALRVRDLAHPAGQLWLWTTSRSVGDAFLLMQLWGFDYRALFTWVKPLGMGRHCRHQIEFLLWAARPGARLVEPRNCPRQIQTWPKPKRHSEKPPEAYDLIRELSDGPRIDIFARQARPGFTPWGNEAPMHNNAITNSDQ
jgi:N6-adenosine-specific RNA methylase IME4